MLNKPRLRRLASALGWAREVDEVPEPAAASAVRAAPRRERIVALLVPESGESTFRLRAVPDAEALPDDVPDGAGSIYRTGDGKIVLDWHRAS